MSIKRRDVLKLGAMQAAVLTLPPISVEAADFVTAPRLGPSILQGATDETSTQFSIVHDRQLKIRAFVTTPSGGTWNPIDVRVYKMADQPRVVTKIYFNGLHLGESFQLNLVDEENRMVDTRNFKTLDLMQEKIKFALCSCMDHERHEPAIWRDLVEKKPDVILFIGDSAYADRGAPTGGANAAHLWKKFSDARAVLEIYFSKTLIPIFAVWDDHDFGRNDSDTSFPYAKESRENFETFFAQNPDYCRNLKRGPGVSSALKIGQQQFIFLDDRSFRAARGSNDKHAHWGREQEEWMYSLVGSHSGLTWLINGSQYMSRMPWKESVSRDHPTQLKEFVKNLKTLPKVVLVSGDVHYSEISELEESLLGYVTYEITSSSMHSPCVPGFPHLIPNGRRMACTGKRNYVLIEAVPDGAQTKIKVASYSKDGRVKFQKDLRV